MTALAFGGLLGDPVLTSVLFGFLGAALGSAVLFARAGAFASRAAPPRSEAEREGAAFRVEDGRMLPRNAEAVRWTGAVEPPPELSRLAGWFPDDAEALARRLGRLEAEGRAFRALADHVDGRTYEVVAAPEGGEAEFRIAPAVDAPRALSAARRECADLRRENARLAEALDAAPVLVWRREADASLSWANRPYRALSGADGAAAPPQELPGAADHAGDGAGRSVRKSSGRQCFFDARTGERRWFDLCRVWAADGGEIGYAVDAAPVISAEAALRRFVETLTETFAHLKIGLAIFDGERRLGLFNPAFSKLMRLDPAWLAGRPGLTDVLRRLRDSRMMPEQQDFPAWRKRLLDLFDKPEAADHHDVWRLPGDLTIRVLARPHPQGALAFLFEDVSETISLEERYRTEAQMRRATMDRLEEGLAVFGPDGITRFANPSFHALWGFEPGAGGEGRRACDVIEKCAALAEPTEDLSRLREFVAGCDGRDGRGAWAARIRLLDGRVLRGRFAPLPDGSTLTAFLDGSEAERTLAANPDAADPTGSGDLSAALGAVMDRISATAAARDVRLELKFDAEAGGLPLDGAAMRQILYNLITDAARRCPPGGAVEATAARRGDMLEISTRIPHPADAPPPELGGVAHGLVRRLAELREGRVSVAVEPPETPESPARLVVACALPASEGMAVRVA